MQNNFNTYKMKTINLEIEALGHIPLGHIPLGHIPLGHIPLGHSAAARAQALQRKCAWIVQEQAAPLVLYLLVRTR